MRVEGVDAGPVGVEGDPECADDEQPASAVAAATTTQRMTDVLRSMRGSLACRKMRWTGSFGRKEFVWTRRAERAWMYEHCVAAHEAVGRLVYASMSRDVVVLRWPEQGAERERLERLAIPRLLIVEAGTEPPPSESCLEDWLRLPAEDCDVRARLLALSRRAACHPMVPVLDDFGQLTHRGVSVFLSPVDQRVAQVLVESFGAAVRDAELARRAWPAGSSEQTLRVHISRLRRRISELGLTITCVRNVGYVMREQALSLAREAT
jgi:Transcriptional regulatory protein, C terminal